MATAGDAVILYYDGTRWQVADDVISYTVAGGLKLGTATATKLAFYGVTPVTQQAHADQAQVPAYTAHAAGATPVTSNAATDLDTTAAQVAALTTYCRRLHTDLVALGLVKGSAP